MKYSFTPLFTRLCALSLVTVPVYAVTNESNANPTLQQQIAELKNEVAALKQQMKPAFTTRVHKIHALRASPQTALTPNQTTSAQISTLIEHAEIGDKKADLNAPNIAGPQYLPQTGVQYFPYDVDVPGQSFVSTGPYIGVPLQYSGANLIVNSPSVNQDVALLNLRKNINQRLAALGLKPKDQHSHLLLSGVIEGQANYKNRGRGADTSDIDLTSVGIDAYVLGPSGWVSGIISLNYDNNIGAQTGSLAINSRSQNSRVFVNKAFITVGDFTQSPFYGSLGQMYVPFGTYSTSLVSSPLTKLAFRTQERALLVGYQTQNKNGVYGSAFIFRGDTHVGSATRINNGGLNAGYHYACDYFSGNWGGSVIANVADSQGMQNTGNGAIYVPPSIAVPPSAPLFGGFGGVSGTGNEQIAHRVPGYNLRGLFSFGRGIDLLAEYITASTSFSAADLSINGHGARPQALNAEAAYTFQSIARPTSITLGYGMTKDGLPLGLPSQRYSLVMNTSLWRNTLQSLEFRHDRNYAASKVATGSGILAATESGKSDNMVTAQFDIYF